jgi:hypothetical protein
MSRDKNDGWVFDITEPADRRQQDTQEQELMWDQDRNDKKVLDRVLMGETTVDDYKYLAARLNYRG